MLQENQKSKKQSWDMGYYIALILCVAAVGISGYLFTTTLQQETEKDPSRETVSTILDRPTVPEVMEEPVLPASATEPVLVEKPRSAEAEPVAPVEAPAEPEILGQTVFPVEGTMLRSYSMDHLSYNATTRDWRTHDGVDFAAAAGSQVLAAADGVVESVFDDDFLGKTVTVRHPEGYVTRYANLAEEVLVSAGQSVKAGEALGTVGNSALLELAQDSHLHFAVFHNGLSVDPEEFLKQNVS